jgi:signal transduction histidine kinase/CheY-like chemotaxis protein
MKDLMSDINRDYAVAMNYASVDRFMIKILWWHFGFVALMAFTNSYLRLSDWFRSPFSWRVLGAGEALAAVLVGFAAAAVPTLARGKLGNHYAWRVVVSVALTTYSYLFVFMSGGSIEMHFHFFMVMALITVYSDWRLGWIVLVLTALHHGILNYVAPTWVYFYGRNDLAVLAHALPVTATAIFTSLLCINNRRSVVMHQASRQELEREIEDRVRAQEAMAKAKAEAEQANQAKSEFLSRTSHELRTPLNGILGFAQLLEMEPLEPQEQESVAYILRAGRHLLQLIDEVLDIARIETGRLAMSPEPILVQAAVQEALDLIRPLTVEMNVALDLETRSSPDLYIQADGQRIKQVLLNLLSNAVKYNRKGGTVTLRYAETGEGRLRIEVSDTGPGIPPDKMERLFTPFDRLGAEQRGIEGSGLGLSLSKRLVDVMGGTLGVESRVGRGSIFWMEFPAAAGPLRRLDGVNGIPPEPPVDADRILAVLYIEDNVSNVKLVERILRRRPAIRLRTAAEGQRGIELAREHRPDLILLDLHLPDIPGHNVLRHLQGDPATRDIPVIVISADATPSQLKRLREAGSAGYLTKPIDIREFLELLDHTLDRRPNKAMVG